MGKPIYRRRIAESYEFEAYDKVCTAVITKQAMASLFPQIRGVRAAFVQGLKEKFADYNLTYCIGGQISLDAPHWIRRDLLSATRRGLGSQEDSFFLVTRYSRSCCRELTYSGD